MEQRYRKAILKSLQGSGYQPQSLAALARQLGIDRQDLPAFEAAFEQLRRDGLVIMGEGGMVYPAPVAGMVTGIFRANQRGFGFVCPLEPGAHASLFIPPDAVGDAMNGDVVLARVVRKRRSAGQVRYSGQVVKVVKRAADRFAGTLLKAGRSWVVQPDGKGFVEPIHVDDVTAKDARANDKVVVQIISYPSGDRPARGVIVQVLGRAGHYEAEIASVIEQFKLRSDFEQACLDEAAACASSFDATSTDGIEDLTDKLIITIDPPDAKDFDDAISLEIDGNGRWVLGVHIADVARFVRPDSALDREARLRGNSVYLPGRTLPMLPEVLSNGICSLQPGQRRFTKTVSITYDKEGTVVSRRFCNSLIRSTQRLTYQQADAALKGHTADLEPGVAGLLWEAERLARTIERRRHKEGMIQLAMPEVELVMDKAGRVVDAQPADTSYPHTIIEMFMVEANEAVAGLLDRLDIPFLRRIHPEPDPMALKELSRLVRTLGIKMPRIPDRQSIQDLLRLVKGRDSELAVNMLVLRSLEKAVYSPLNIGHYALASRAYTHFTSPIRRYADLTIHRALQYYLDGRVEQARREAQAQDLTDLGRHLTFTEQCAEDAEEDLKAVLILQMLSKRPDTVIDGVVTGVASFGVFVRCRRFGIEGLIKAEDLGPDRWLFQDKSLCLVGQRSGVIVGLGQPIQAKIVSVNVPARQLNLAPVRPLVEAKRARRR
ncbi:MAG: ribonuclease R [Sedimentisphaerales bacterium]|nr:ribonuclease R [Sedimentisphaerales bacterium]